MNIRKRRPAAGFTLVEMLVVIAIIGVLAGLVGVAAMGAMDKMKQARIKTEIDLLDAALKNFKQQYGAYPPCDLRIDTSSPPQYPNQNTLMGFLQQAFPRYIYNGNAAKIASDLQACGISTTTFNPDRALVFWLMGFSPDATNPFQGLGTRTPLFNFDTTRLYDMTTNTAGFTPGSFSAVLGHYAYVPQSGNGTPYVYFDSSVYGNIANSVSAANPPGLGDPAQYAASSITASTPGTATPYVLDANNSGTFSATTDTFCNPTSFQIISAGQDGQFGAFGGSVFRLYPVGTGYDASGEEDDNVANFSGSSSLADAKPN